MKSSEKKLVIASTFAVALLLGAGYWWQNLNQTPQVTIPSPKMPSPNAFDIYAKAYFLNVKRPSALNEGYNPKTGRLEPNNYKTWEERLPFYRKPELQVWLACNQPAINTLRQGFQYEYRHPPIRSLSGISSYSDELPFMARTLDTASHIYAARGDWHNATICALDALHLGHDFSRGGPMTSANTGNVSQSYGRRLLEFMLPHLDVKACRMAAQRLEKLHQNRVKPLQIIEEDKWAGQAQLLLFMQQSDWHKVANELSGNVSWKSKRFYSKKGVMDGYTAYMDALIIASQKPFTKTSWPQQPTTEILKSITFRPSTAWWSPKCNETANALLIVVLALRAYRLERGVHPEKLDALVPSYLQAIPADPFGGGEVLRYQKKGTDYKLWSIGTDGKDDGGRPVEDKTQKPNSRLRFLVKPESVGDFVFGINN